MGRILTGALVLIVGYVSFPLGNSILHFNKPYILLDCHAVSPVRRERGILSGKVIL